MKKALIATFSQNGSTTKIADQIGKGVSSSNCEVTQLLITANSIPDLKEYDIIGIGTPTYFFRPPFVVMDFVKALEGIENKSSFVFALYGTDQGDCGNWIRRKLKKKGSRDVGYFKCFGADYWLGYIKRNIFFSHTSPTEQELSAAELFGKVVAKRVDEKSLQVEKFDPAMPFMYRLERMLVAQPFAKMIYSRTFTVDKSCNKCGICVKKCPIANISETGNGKLKWQSNCMLCLSCELSCPKDAIRSAFDWIIFAPFMHYNISRSKNNVPFAHVIHRKGKTVLT
jgi:flavodoxin/NAD-dependent dihydropyrimidine dehydrogenase PreA subunit